MNQEKSQKSQSSVWWWIIWIILTIGSFFVAAHFWTWFIAERVGSMRQPGIPILWVAAVFGTWMILLVPLIIVMYNKVDKAYEDARLKREMAALNKRPSNLPFKSVFVDESKRTLPKEFTKKVKRFPQAVKGGHLVTATLKDGRRIENIFVFNKETIVGVYGQDSFPFEADQIADLEPVDLDRLPDFKIENWLRLDGV